jgi:hypothetical protein
MEPRATVNFALESIRRGDLTSAIDRVESDGEAEQVSADHAQLIKILYAQDKDVTNMAAVGKAAVRYHLRRSELERNVAATLKLKTAAKRLACNVAANCWPAGAMRAWSSRPRISMRGLSSRSCRCDWSRNWRSAPISSATPIGSSARFSSPPEEPMPLCCRSDRRATPSRQLQELLADGYRAIAYRQAPDRADRSARELDAVIDGLIADGSKQARGSPTSSAPPRAFLVIDDRAGRRDAEIAEWAATDAVGGARRVTTFRSGFEGFHIGPD